jgi:hypothetical protein
LYTSTYAVVAPPPAGSNDSPQLRTAISYASLATVSPYPISVNHRS